eukprot:3327044-Rhodomonas_salina.1
MGNMGTLPASSCNSTPAQRHGSVVSLESLRPLPRPLRQPAPLNKTPEAKTRQVRVLSEVHAETEQGRGGILRRRRGRGCSVGSARGSRGRSASCRSARGRGAGSRRGRGAGRQRARTPPPPPPAPASPARPRPAPGLGGSAP